MSGTTVASVRLLASSNTVAGITTCIRRFWGADRFNVNPETLAIEVTDGNVPECIDRRAVRVICKRGRYRFERVLP